MEVYTLDNGIDYKIVCEKNIDNQKYILFADINDPTNICIRKLVTNEDGVEGFIYLDNEKEFEKAMLVFSKEAVIELNEMEKDL